MKIQVILGSIRPGRNGEKIAKWAMSNLKSTSEVEYELIDLKDWSLPLELEAKSPSIHEYEGEETIRWAEKIAEGDGYIWITPEYNHSYSAALKNALDHIYAEWNKKPVGIIGYGSVGGARAVEHLRGVAAELQMASMRTAVHIMSPWSAFDEKGNLKDEETYRSQLGTMLEQLLWWAKALKTTRNSAS
jgi:NAD(P)H-dependent FMN reductase